MARKLRIYLWSDNTGVGWYRIHSPARTIKKLGLAEVKTSDFRWTEENDKIEFPSMEELNEIVAWADIVVFQRHDMIQHIATFCGLGEHANLPIVLETDDNIDAVRPFNPGYRGYHPGSEAHMWGQLVPKKVDAITVTTKSLYDLHQKDNPGNVYILPNSLDLKWRDKFLVENKNKKIRIGWLGSAAHFENLKLIEKPVYEILSKHKNVEFVCMDMYATLWAGYPKDIQKRIKRIKWAKLKQWPKAIADARLDIGLAPALDNNFNRAKSNLRYLEYSVNKTATIASPTACYDCIVDGVTGLHATEPHEWFNAMEKLIEDEALRKRIGENARKDLEKNYDIEKNAIMWVDAYKDIVKKYRAKNGGRNYISV